jgi:hypothetical protein
MKQKHTSSSITIAALRVYTELPEAMSAFKVALFAM